jgi:DNA (cytosine-5)-methyltransferase 1
MEALKMGIRNSPRVLGLFSGAGGIEIGFAQAGFQIVASVELVPQFCRTLEANEGLYGRNHKVVCADIAKFEPAEHGIVDIDFVIGGPPCQSFSAAGRRAGGVFGLNDLRGSLFWHYCRILKSLRPKGFLFENVRGILSANSRNAWDVITGSFAEVGYTLHHRVLDAAEYGVPQHRERVLMVGTRQDTEFRFPVPTHGPASFSRTPYVSAGAALADIDDPTERYVPYGGKYESELLEIPPGSNYLFFTEKMGHPSPRFAWRSRFSDFLYVADPAIPTKTIVAQPGKWAGPFHWRKRKFTIRELKRLFSFPDNYSVVGGEMAAIKQIGNSVPPKLANVIARSIKQQLFGVKEGLVLSDPGAVFDHDRRKGRKALQTRARVKKNAEIYGGTGCRQRGLFEDDSTPEVGHAGLVDGDRVTHTLAYTDLRECLVDHADSTGPADRFCVTMSSSKGHIAIDATQQCGGRTGVIDLAVNFNRPVNGRVQAISAAVRMSSIRTIGVTWDCIDLAIRTFTSYDCCQKLYGHFTEPYPQFTFRIQSRRWKKDPLFQFQKSLEDYSVLSEYRRLSSLATAFGHTGRRAGTAIAQELRTIGFDVRTHETNRTVEEGHYRICYPFTISLASASFVTWREKGKHRTADRTSIPLAAT